MSNNSHRNILLSGVASSAITLSLFIISTIYDPEKDSVTNRLLAASLGLNIGAVIGVTFDYLKKSINDSKNEPTLKSPNFSSTIKN